ncbi:MAG: hypothetical protein ACKVX7_07900 [Planctomycetota bacterium]
MTQSNRGSALVLVLILAIGLLSITLVSFELSRAQSLTVRTQREVLMAREIAQSAAAQAFARIKEAGFVEPWSGTGTAPAWVDFSDGQLFYYTDFDESSSVSTVRAWGRVAYETSPSSCMLAPDDVAWNGDGWELEGVEITIKATKYIPNGPVYFGNGGVEMPMGGFAWTGGSDPLDPTTWGTITSSPASYQASSLPFQASALNYPADYIYNGGSPDAAVAGSHPYPIWTTQNPIGQMNIEAWFNNSGGTGVDPETRVTPAPTSTYFDTSNKNSPNYPYPIDPHVTDVQSFTWDLWSTYMSDPASPKLANGNNSGTYGNMTTPKVTFVTGQLTVPAGRTFQGAGILVIRDNFDPNTDTNNTPATRASLTVDGIFKWTGLVIVAGWAPTIRVRAGGDATIVGSLFGEDSVQSGGEVSLDSATITLVVNDDLRVYYSNDLFASGGLVNNLMPEVNKEVVGVRVLGP